MKVGWVIGHLVILLASGSTTGQDVFSLNIEGPSTLEGEGTVRATYEVMLGHTGSEPGAEAWSFGVTAYGTGGARIVSATTAETAGDLVSNGGFREGGFEKTETIDPGKNGGRSGAVSQVVLSMGGVLSLPANETFSVASLEAEFEIPLGRAHSGQLGFEGELVGSGLPVDLRVMQEGAAKRPDPVPKYVILREGPDCCRSSFNVGFSTQVLRLAPPFEGVEGVGPKCEASSGIVDHIVREPYKVYLNMITQHERDFGVQGWSLSIRLEGDGDMLSATTAGTAADWSKNGGLFDGGFNKTQVVDPIRNDGRKGAVSAIILSLGPAELPRESTETVLALELNGPEGSTSVLSVVDGLRGLSRPVPNIVIFTGESYAACNAHTARLTIRHRIVDDLIRGDANGDAKLDIADAVWIVRSLYYVGPPAPCTDAADANDDGRIDLSDAVHLIRYLFLTGEAPPRPFPECGIDGTEDDLDCQGVAPPC